MQIDGFIYNQEGAEKSGMEVATALLVASRRLSGQEIATNNQECNKSFQPSQSWFGSWGNRYDTHDLKLE